MGKTSSEAKQRWNEKHYSQVKIMVSPELAKAFKTACAEAGQTMNGTLVRYMESSVCKETTKSMPTSRITTKSQRRKSLRLLLDNLCELRDAEYRYKENIPENLHNSRRFEQSEESIEKLDEAIMLLEDAF